MIEQGNKGIRTDEQLASEDWKCLFLVTLTILLITLGYIVHMKLVEPEEYCSKDICVKLNEDK